jgi:uncharacterized protein (UPF0335 family)
MSAEDEIRKMAEHAKDPKRFSKDALKSFVERIERLHGERKELGNDVRDVYAEAKNLGYSTRALKRVIKLREYEAEHGRDARLSEDFILETYMTALGIPSP